MTKKVTIKDVAKLAGVSPASVSQVLNGNAASFHQDTVTKILTAKETLNYTPNYFAQGMVKKNSMTIGVLVPDITNPFFSNLVSGIDSILYQHDYITMLGNVGFEKEKELRHIKEYSRRGVDGFVIASSANDETSMITALNQEDKPYVFLDNEATKEHTAALLVDDFAGGKLAGQHLYDLGHREVVVIAPENPSLIICHRIDGFSSVFFKKPQIIYTAFSKEGGRLVGNDIVKTSATAIFTINDDLAFGVYLALTDLGKKIPDDYSVIGYDNVPMSEYVEPKLTTIAQPIFELGERTALMLLDRIKRPDKPQEQIVLPVHLIKRNSTAPLK